LWQLGLNKPKEPFAILNGFFSFFTGYKSFLILGHVLDVDDAAQSSGVSLISFIDWPDGSQE